MLTPIRWFVPVLLVGWLLTVGPAFPQNEKATENAYGVRDKAELFSEDARRLANAECSYINHRFKKDVLVETFSMAPESIKEINLQDAAAKRKFFQNWASERAKSAKVDGVYILISTNPKYLEALAWPPSERSGLFSGAHANALAQKMLEQLKTGHKDDALLDGVTFVRQTMASHVKATNGKKE